MAYRFISRDTRTDAPLAELPLTGVKWGQKLDGAGAFQARLALPVDDPIRAALYIDATQRWRRVIYVERNGVLVGDPYFIWAREYKDGFLTIAASGLWSVFKRRFLTDTHTTDPNVVNAVLMDGDQTSGIAATLVAYAQSKPGADLGIATDCPASGVTRDRTYWHYEFKAIDAAVSELAAVEGGFDFGIDIAIDSNDDLLKTFRTHYPRKGRIAGASGHVWEMGRNMISIAWPEDGTEAGNAVYGIGAGEGEAMIGSSATRGDLLDAGFPLLEYTKAWKDVSIPSTLDGHVNAELGAVAEGVTLPPITVWGNKDPQIGSYIVGDEARIRIQPGADSFFPNGLDTYRRILEYEVDVPDEGGNEKVTITTGAPVSG